jgi:hypothetical protein
VSMCAGFICFLIGPLVGSCECDSHCLGFIMSRTSFTMFQKEVINVRFWNLTLTFPKISHFTYLLQSVQISQFTDVVQIHQPDCISHMIRQNSECWYLIVKHLDTLNLRDTNTQKYTFFSTEMKLLKFHTYALNKLNNYIIGWP